MWHMSQMDLFIPHVAYEPDGSIYPKVAYEPDGSIYPRCGI